MIDYKNYDAARIIVFKLGLLIFDFRALKDRFSSSILFIVADFYVIQ